MQRLGAGDLGWHSAEDLHAFVLEYLGIVRVQCMNQIISKINN